MKLVGIVNVGNFAALSDQLLSVEILSSYEDGIFLFLQHDFTVPDLHSHLAVAAILEINILSDIIVLSGTVLIVTVQVAVFCP